MQPVLHDDRWPGKPLELATQKRTRPGPRRECTYRHGPAACQPADVRTYPAARLLANGQSHGAQMSHGWAPRHAPDPGSPEGRAQPGSSLSLRLASRSGEWRLRISEEEPQTQVRQHESTTGAQVRR